ncbi:MAG: hypothetical protein V4602_06450 [Pseudomonadota bacterium]
MTKMKAIQKQLQREIQSYTRGGVPIPLELLQAPRIDYWVAEVRRRGQEFVLVVAGDVVKHPDMDDGASIQTSAVVWWDRHNRFFRTVNRLYVLGLKAGITGGVRQ